MSAFPSTVARTWRYAGRFDRRDWLRCIGWLAALATPLFLLVATRYLAHVAPGGARDTLYLASAWIAHFGAMPLLLGAVLVPLAVLLPVRSLLLPLGTAAMAAILALLLLDTAIYDRYRFHLSGFVWEIVGGPGALDTLGLSWVSLAVALGAAAGVALATLLAMALAVRIVAERRLRGLGKYLLSAWVGCTACAHLMHAWHEAHYDAGITGVTRHFPLYHPMTAKRLLVDLGWLDPSRAREAHLTGLDRPTDAGLRYPVAPLECRTPEAPLNVLVIAIDAMRADVFSADVTPGLFALSERPDALRFTDHISGGNVTKGGIFSLFYGLPAAYWDGFAAAGRGAEWVRQHQAAGYAMGVFSSATLQSPAFDRTVFASVPKLRLGSDGDRPAARDRDAIADLERFVAGRAPDEPWFGFLFLDALHGYDVPAGYEKFRPQWERVDHVRLNPDFPPEPYFNRYRNALHFLDESVSALLSRLRASGALDDTLVVLTSDHGEEFNDLGQNHWGHGSNFSVHQTRVPLLMLWPGRRRATIHHRTSHFDVAPTVMREVLGCTNDASDYAMGGDLMDAGVARDWLLVHSYFNYGIVTDERIIATYPVGTYEIRDLDNRRIVDAKLDPRIGSEVLREVTRFYR